MECKFLIRNCAFFLALFISIQSFSQEDSSTFLPNITITQGSNEVTVSERVSKSFNSYFKNAENTRWYQANKDYLVKFILDDMDHNALFQKNGRLVYDISYGTEEDLPKEIRAQIKSNYFDKSISRVVNVKELGRNIWIVNLEDTNNLVLVRIEEGEMEEVSNLKKIM